MDDRQPSTITTKATLALLSIPVVALFAALAGYFWLTAGESFEEHYASYGDAIADRAIERGWVPQSIPQSSREIRQYGDIDTNYSFGSFLFDPKDWPEFENKLQEASDFGNVRIDDEAECAPSEKVSLATAGFLVYREKTPDGYVIAVKPERGCALFFNGI